MIHPMKSYRLVFEAYVVEIAVLGKSPSFREALWSLVVALPKCPAALRNPQYNPEATRHTLIGMAKSFEKLRFGIWHALKYNRRRSLPMG